MSDHNNIDKINQPSTKNTIAENKYIAPDTNTVKEVKKETGKETKNDDTKIKRNQDKTKKKKRRRNYDELDSEIEKQSANNKKSKKTGDQEQAGIDSNSNNHDDDEDEEIDDEKLDMLPTMEGEADDDLEEIDVNNIIDIGRSTRGRRTRGKIIDYEKTARLLEKEENGNKREKEEDDGDEDEDADFKPE
ncbi:Chz1p SCDLUD_002329 [Saccharomycodes ludwigii]|uniref:Chz1p n=1 Tax=Saccharomycodes ludwigii TaxID=36035 RepID=UPI001E872EF5|nr:hypothetical protein SCDLUD_002329 [Saccharomycodes ludwigii]KAH3900873.1 hypothetical protein SCDLUD_002329 [Saccharomycodes ludwigii]